MGQNQKLTCAAAMSESLEWVKQWLGYPSHYLPVVATGLIPRIYRRAAFPHRATPKSLPL